MDSIQYHGQCLNGFPALMLNTLMPCKCQVLCHGGSIIQFSVLYATVPETHAGDLLFTQQILNLQN